MSELVKVMTQYPAVKVRRLVKLAEQNQRSLAGEIRVALDRHLEAHSAKGERQ